MQPASPAGSESPTNSYDARPSWLATVTRKAAIVADIKHAGLRIYRGATIRCRRRRPLTWIVPRLDCGRVERAVIRRRARCRAPPCQLGVRSIRSSLAPALISIASGRFGTVWVRLTFAGTPELDGTVPSDRPDRLAADAKRNVHKA